MVPLTSLFVEHMYWLKKPDLYTNVFLFVIVKHILVPPGYKGNDFTAQAEPRQAYLIVC